MSKNTTPKNILNYLVQELKSKFAEKSEIPSVNNNTITTQLNGTTVDSFTLNQATDKTINIQVSGSKSVNGNPIAIEDAANAYAEEVIANIEPIQDLHGYDHPWVGGAGKNLLPMTVEGIKAANTEGTWNGNAYTFNGVTYTILTDSDGNVIGIKTNGTSTDRSFFYLFINTQVNVSGNVFMSFKKNGIGGVGILKDGSWIGEAVDFSFLVNSKIETVWISVLASTTVDTILTPQLELGTSATTFEPYSNISPITGITQLDIDRCGKNLFPYDSFNQSSGSHLHAIIPKGEYVISAVRSRTTSPSIGLNIRFWHDSVNSTVITGITDSSKKIVFDRDVIEISYSITNFQSGDSIYNIQLESGSNKTEYEPYQSETHSTQLPQTTYGGTLNVQTGELVVNRKLITIDQNTSKRKYNNVGKYFRFISYVADDAKPSQGPISDKAVGFWPDSSSTDALVIWVSDGASRLSILTTTLITPNGTLEELNSWLAINPLQVCYELATPIIYHLTPSQVKLLKDYNYISTNADTLDIVYQVNNVLGEILSESEEYTDRVNKSEIIEITPGDGTTSRTFTFSRTPKKVTISWDETDNWCRYHTFLWGDKRTYGFAGNVNSALTGQYAIVAAITYGADGKSFVVSGENASAAFNTTTGSGRLFVEY